MCAMNESKPKVGTPLEIVRMNPGNSSRNYLIRLAGLSIDNEGFPDHLNCSGKKSGTVTLFASCRLIFDFYTNGEKRNDCRIRLLRKKVFLFRWGSCSAQTIPPGLGIEHNVQSLLIRIIKKFVIL